MRLEDILKDVPDKWHAPLIEFIDKGEATAAFERELDSDPVLQQAVEKALEGVSEGLESVGKTLKQINTGKYEIDPASRDLASKILSSSREAKGANVPTPLSESL